MLSWPQISIAVKDLSKNVLQGEKIYKNPCFRYMRLSVCSSMLWENSQCVYAYKLTWNPMWGAIFHICVCSTQSLKRGNMAMKGARFPLESTWKYHSFVKYRTTKLYCKTTNFWYLCELCSESSTGCINMYRKIFNSPYITMHKVLECINIYHINYQ